MDTTSKVKHIATSHRLVQRAQVIKQSKIRDTKSKVCKTTKLNAIQISKIIKNV